MSEAFVDDKHSLDDPIDNDARESMYALEHGADGRWLPRRCVICDQETNLRCAACHTYVCHLHEHCPNGCE